MGNGNTKVLAKDLAFSLDPMWPRKSTWWQRFITRLAVKHFLNGNSRTFQFGGYTGAKRLSFEMVDANKEQMAHWMLRDLGYSVCPADIMELTGYDEYKEKPIPANKTPGPLARDEEK